MSHTLLCLLLIGAAAIHEVQSQVTKRQRIKFDFGYLFWLGQDVPGLAVDCPLSDFPIDMSGIQCMGLSQAYVANATECRIACCEDVNCGTYQWCPASGSGCTPASSCWVGARNDCDHPNTGWQSRGRPTPGPPIGPIQPDYDDSQWQKKDVPHDFIVETGAFSPQNEKSHGYLPKNISWYRKHFSLDSSFQNSKIWIDFDGVYRASDTYLNGQYLGNHASGYTSFRWYIDQIQPLHFGADSDNVLAMRVDPTHDEGWWYEGGGIYRHTWLNVANKLHLTPWGVYAPSNVTRVLNSTHGHAVMFVDTNITNDYTAAMTCSLKTDVVDITSGKTIATNTMSNINVAAGVQSRVRQSFNNLPNAVRLWSLETPALHRVDSTLIMNNGNVDSVSNNIGFRKTYFDANKGMYLNDQPVKVKGFCNHQDFAGCGTAVPDRVNRFRVQTVLEMGGNSWRMSHNPPNPELLDFADEYGLLVWDENRNMASNAQYLQDQADMINRDKNHPSIVIWSLCNEGGCMEGSSQSGAVAQMFVDVIATIDYGYTELYSSRHKGTYRPISAAMNGDWGDPMSAVLDIQGINYSTDHYDSYHKANPTQNIISSESCSCLTTRGEYVANATSGHCSSYQSCIWSCWQPVIDRDFVDGSYDWTGFDYKGEPTPYGWPAVNSNFGILDIAGFPKDDYFYYRSWFLESALTIHILPFWTFTQDRSGDKIQVWVYSNAKFIDLQLNGNSVSNGMQAMAMNAHLSFEVVYKAGTLTAVGYDANKRVVGNHSIETTGSPSAVHLVVDYPSSGSIMADGQDVCMIRAEVRDSQGRVVPMASNMITFAVSGPGTVYGVGNGDDACHEPDKANTRSAFHGLARVIVQSEMGVAGKIQVTASAHGLTSDSVSITSVSMQKL